MGTSAGQTVKGRDEFKPIQKWSNKSTHPSQVLLLKYHTQQTLEIMERCSGESNKSVKRVRVDPTEVIDLTEDEDAPRVLSAVIDSITSSSSSAVLNSSSVPVTPSSLTKTYPTTTTTSTSAVLEEEHEVVNEDVTVIRQSKQIPLLDISDDQAAPEWSFTSL